MVYNEVLVRMMPRSVVINPQSANKIMHYQHKCMRANRANCCCVTVMDENSELIRQQLLLLLKGV